MKNFEKRRDRYELFRTFDNPLVNIVFQLDVPDFRPYCKARQIPVFHFFLFCVLNTVKQSDNFMYRIYRDDVIRIDDFPASYTVINCDGNLNFTRFPMTDQLDVFIARSLEAKRIAEASSDMINNGDDMDERERRNSVFITSLPWLDMTAIDHPVYCHRDADIPTFTWGKFGPAQEDGRMKIPFSVQAHHGFVDGYHIQKLAQDLAQRIASMIA
ncbi:CatA-like O-acetyltransferase [Janthinobacterium sp. Mn2066]|uniref:CatA-like O-acetyltransferase n=1 Tax=Janthinobacterium sp. Mn2066 TaxID=3395264 RepID=UPI003BDDC40E